MNITNVKIHPIGGESMLKAVVSVTLDDAIVIHEIKLLAGESGLFIAMPSRKTQNGKFKDIAHPINSASREILENAVISAYCKALLNDSE